MHDEVDSLLHVEPDFAQCGVAFCVGAGRSWWAGSGGVRFQKRHREDDQGGADEAGGVKYVTADGTEGRDHEGGDGRADDAHAKHDLLHKRVGRAQAVQRNGRTYSDSLGGCEEAGDDADSSEDRVKVPGLTGEDEQKNEPGADGVARNHGWLQGPAVDKDSGQDAQHGDGEHVGDLDAGDLLGVGVELEGEDADNGEEREEVSEDGDDLGVPEAAQHGDAENRAHR